MSDSFPDSAEPTHSSHWGGFTVRARDGEIDAVRPLHDPDPSPLLGNLGTVLLSNRGNPMLRIEEDTCGRHDTLGGACSAESNTVRYALDKRHMHSCRDSFLLALARHRPGGMTKRDLPAQHQLLHERAGDAGGRTDVRRRHLRARAATCELRALHGRAGADLQLPAAQQSLQRLQSRRRFAS